MEKSAARSSIESTTESAAAAAEMALSASPAPRLRELPIVFTASGSEYFRIWAVNLLLILMSGGLYLPFAKQRRIRYFYANTLIDGEALAFHGDSWRMFRGFVIVVALMAVYSLTSNFSPAVAIPAFLLLCAVWPAMWRAAMQFRLGNTSWRGLRFGFHGSLAGAYRAFLPIYVPALLVTALTPDDPKAPLSWQTGLYYLAMAASILMLPWATALMRRYQHQNFSLAGERSGLSLNTRAIYFIGWKTLWLTVGLFIVTLMLTFVLGGLLALATSGKIDAPGNGQLYGLIWLGLTYLLGGSVVLAYHASRVQNLVWTNTKSASLSFESTLTGLPWLTLKNWVLIVLTLGLYRPFAVVATVRLRLHSVRIETRTDPESWQAQPTTAMQDASGEVAGDFFGVDVGL